MNPSIKKSMDPSISRYVGGEHDDIDSIVKMLDPVRNIRNRYQSQKSSNSVFVRKFNELIQYLHEKVADICSPNLNTRLIIIYNMQLKLAELDKLENVEAVDSEKMIENCDRIRKIIDLASSSIKQTTESPKQYNKPTSTSATSKQHNETNAEKVLKYSQLAIKQIENLMKKSERLYSEFISFEEDQRQDDIEHEIDKMIIKLMELVEVEDMSPKEKEIVQQCTKFLDRNSNDTGTLVLMYVHHIRMHSKENLLEQDRINLIQEAERAITQFTNLPTRTTLIDQAELLAENLLKIPNKYKNEKLETLKNINAAFLKLHTQPINDKAFRASFMELLTKIKEYGEGEEYAPLQANFDLFRPNKSYSLIPIEPNKKLAVPKEVFKKVFLQKVEFEIHLTDQEIELRKPLIDQTEKLIKNLPEVGALKKLLKGLKNHSSDEEFKESFNLLFEQVEKVKKVGKTIRSISKDKEKEIDDDLSNLRKDFAEYRKGKGEIIQIKIGKKKNLHEKVNPEKQLRRSLDQLIKSVKLNDQETDQLMQYQNQLKVNENQRKTKLDKNEQHNIVYSALIILRKVDGVNPEKIQEIERQLYLLTNRPNRTVILETLAKLEHSLSENSKKLINNLKDSTKSDNEFIVSFNELINQMEKQKKLKNENYKKLKQDFKSFKQYRKRKS